MTPIATAIKSILTANPGAENALTGRELLARLNDILRERGQHAGDRKMRRVIEDELPDVCFSTGAKGKPPGYFFPLPGPAGDVEVAAVLRQLKSYRLSIVKREQSIEAAYPTASQMSLGFQP
jgi:hypothetical protein